jgi:glycosyltransferase involved in cell wall biosynthesis
VRLRSVDYASFALLAPLAKRAAGAADLVVGETPPLPAALAGYAISKLDRCPYVCNVADPWVNSAVALGVLRSGAAIRGARALERLVYRRAALVTAVTDGVRDSLVESGVPPHRIRVIPNGVDTAVFRPDVDGGAWRERFGGEGTFVAVYAGNHGLAQGVGVLLDAAALLRGNDDMRIVLAGDGAEKDALRRRAEREHLSNVTFLAAQPLADVPALLAASDVCLAALRRLPVFRSAVPSKLFEAMATARALVVAAEGEAAAIVREAQAGLDVLPESSEAIAAALLRLRDDPELRRQLGENGRRYAVSERSREHLVDLYEHAFEEAVSGRITQSAAETSL